MGMDHDQQIHLNTPCQQEVKVRLLKQSKYYTILQNIRLTAEIVTMALFAEGDWSPVT